MGFGEERAPFSVGAGVAGGGGGGGGGKNTKGLAVPDDGAVIGRDCSEMYFGFLEDEENILARPPRSFHGLTVLFLLSDRLGRP